jgi:hypothetical protein
VHTIPQIDGWVDVVVAALKFGDLAGYTLLEDAAWVYAVLEDVHQPSDNEEKDWDAATKEHVCYLLGALNDAKDPPSKQVLQVILKALSMEGSWSIPAVKLLCQAKGWFTDIDLQLIMQEHNVWSRMGSVFMNNSVQMRDFKKYYIQLGEMLSSLTQWTPYIHRNPSHWISIYSELNTFYQ